MIKPGDVLVPTKPYLFCIRVDMVFTECADDETEWWWPWDYPIYAGYTRFDLDYDTREPIFEHPDSGCANYFREITPGIYRAKDFYGARPTYFRRQTTPQGDLFR